MHKLLLTTLVALALPAMASAHITSNTSASSQTGGNTAGPGGVVSTGSASASVSTSNVSGSSTSSIYIKTTTNGEVHEESYSSDSSNVQVSVQATPKATTVDVREGEGGKVIKHEVVAAPASLSAQAVAASQATSGVAVAPTSTPDTQGISFAASIVLAVQTFLAGLFSWFS